MKNESKVPLENKVWVREGRRKVQVKLSKLKLLKKRSWSLCISHDQLKSSTGDQLNTTAAKSRKRAEKMTFTANIYPSPIPQA